ncbi:MAG: GMP reductase [Candidatus Woesearchaeota archaeon]
MRIESEAKLDYQDVLIRPKRSTLTSRKDVALEREFKFYHSKKSWKGIPIMSANMASCGTFEIAKALSKHKIITTFHKYYTIADYKKFFKTFNNPDYICYTLGIRDEDVKKLKQMISAKLINKFSFICIDVPNGYLMRFEEFVRKIRSMCPNHIIIAGNVVTNEMTEQLILSGADIVKVGIGPGSVCTTRRMTGIGYPQLSAVIECSDAAHGLANNQGVGLIIADGGCTCPGDIAKAFCAGSDFAMLGSMFSGFEESGGETVEKDGKLFKEYYGSSSNKALLQNYGKKDKHRASEGRYTLIPHKGFIEDFLQDLFGSLRSTGTYIGARKIREFSRRATFILVNRQLNTSLENFDNC